MTLAVGLLLPAPVCSIVTIIPKSYDYNHILST